MPDESLRLLLRIVLDSNVILAGLNSRGTTRDVLQLIVNGKVVLCISSFIVAEVKRSLRIDFRWMDSTIESTIDALLRHAQLIDAPEHIAAVVTDPSDNRILECAVAAHADYIVTGDRKHLLPLDEYQGIRIITPRDFLNLIESRSSEGEL